MQVTYFRERTPGPELAIEDAVAANVKSLLFSEEEVLWSGGSLSVGAGRPDLVVVSCVPDVYALVQGDMATAQILAYLRAVREAKLDTIANRIRKRREIIVRNLDELLEIDAIRTNDSTFTLSPKWREILPEIVTIEAKVMDWQRALSQATRNRIFGHRSFIALPDQIAERVSGDRLFQKTGVGILGVDDKGDVRIVRDGSRRSPRVWAYYYQLAVVIAKHEADAEHAVQYPTQ